MISVSSFGGRAGDILARTFSIFSILTGVAFTGALLLTNRLSETLAPTALPILAQAVTSLFLAHFAIDGYSDRWRLAGKVEPLTELLTVAARYFVLCSIWMIPLLLLGANPATAASITGSKGAPPYVLLAFLLCALLTPAPFLIVSVSASGWGDLLSASHWVRLFRKRRDELVLVFVIFTGAITVLCVLASPLLVIVAWKKREILQPVTVAVGLLATGTAVGLLGRLCGGYARTEEKAAERRPDPRLHPALQRLQVPAATPDEPKQAATAATEAAPAPQTARRKAPLLDAGQRLEILQKELGGNPAGLVDALMRLDADYLPNPAIRHALCVAHLRAGQRDLAIEVAKDAIPLSLRSGNAALAALTFESFLDEPAVLGISNEVACSLGEVFRTLKRDSVAAKAFAHVLSVDGADRRAIRGLMSVAGDLAQKAATAPSAVRIYDFLLAKCSDSPMIDAIRQERSRAERKAATPQSS